MVRGLSTGFLCIAAVLALAGCSPFGALNAFVPAPSGRGAANVPYGPDPRQQLDIYTPSGAARAPVVVFFYGGSWRTGSRTDYAFVGQALASRGILAVVADYRVYPQVTYPAFLDDSAGAVAWTLRHITSYGGDPGRVFVAGHSAGAYNAAMVALDPRWLAKFGASPADLRGWIGISGPYDFLPIGDPDVKPVFLAPATPRDSQPVAHATSASPPALLATGTADRTVDPARNTLQLAAALCAAGVDVKTVQYRGVGHGPLVAAFAAPLRWLAPVLADTAAFVSAPPPRTGDCPAP